MGQSSVIYCNKKIKVYYTWQIFVFYCSVPSSNFERNYEITQVKILVVDNLMHHLKICNFEVRTNTPALFYSLGSWK